MKAFLQEEVLRLHMKSFVTAKLAVLAAKLLLMLKLNNFGKLRLSFE